MHKRKFRVSFVYICVFYRAFSCSYDEIILKSPSQNPSITTEHKLLLKNMKQEVFIYAFSIGSIYISLIQSSKKTLVVKII